MVGQGFYYFRRRLLRRFGRHSKARLIERVKRTNNRPVNTEEWAIWAENGVRNTSSTFLRWLIGTSIDSETILAPCSILAAVSKNLNLYLDKEKFAQEWIRKRMDIVVMNDAIIAATVFCIAGVLYSAILPNWTIQSLYLIWFLVPVLLLVIIFALYVTIVSRMEISIVIAGLFNLRSRRRGFTGIISTRKGRN
jgi:hypothetical protein